MRCTGLPIPDVYYTVAMFATVASAIRLAHLAAAGLFLCGTVSAQDTTVDQSSTDHTTKIEAHLEKPYTVKIEAKPHENYRCKVNVTVDYLQRNNIAHVESVVTNNDCGASSGTYVIALRFLDESQSSQEIEFKESWQRTDEQSLTLVKEYPIGDNVDLRRVRAKNLSCTCVEPIEQQADH